MANLVLRPTADGQYNTWDGYAGGIPHPTAYDLINEKDADGDTNYIVTSSTGAFTCAVEAGLGLTAGSWPRACRIPSVRAVATVRSDGVGANFRWRLRFLGQDYDSDIVTVTSATYVEVFHEYFVNPNGYAWDVPSLNQIELGLLYEPGGGQLRCTKLEVMVHLEPFPHHTLVPDGSGAMQDWAVQPSTSPAYMTVSGVYDGDLSYLHDSTVNNVSTFTVEDLPGTLTPTNIQQVSVTALVKNKGSVVEEADAILRSGAVNYRGGSNTTSVAIPIDGRQYTLLREDYLNDPSTGWPSGLPTATAWTAPQVNALEIGVENSGGGDFRCTSVAAEVWLATTPLTSIDLFPTADGYHQDWSSIVGAAAAWDAVDEDPPDDATSYVLLDSDAAGTSRFASFDVGGAGAVPATERISNVEVRCRVRLGNLPHSSAWVVPVIRGSVPAGSPETYTGRPQLIEGTGGNWFDVVWQFDNNPILGGAWDSLSDVTDLEFGFATLSGTMLLSRVRAQVHTTTDYRGASDATDLQLTDAADAAVTGWITRSTTEGIIYVVRQFAIGTGGYNAADPTAVVAVNPAATSLINEVWRGPVGHIEYDTSSSPWTVDYWCRVPRDAVRGGIGEVALIGEVLWSPIAGEIGTEFLFAVAHHPCQTRHEDSASFYLLRVEYTP
jgi:hypothetical protein